MRRLTPAQKKTGSPSGWRRRQPATRGTAALEFALVMPVFLSVIGLCISVGLGSMVRMQMMSLAHQATRICSIDLYRDHTNISGCIANSVAQLASQPSAFLRVCQLSSPVVSGPTPMNAAYAPAPTYMVHTSLSCSFSLGLSLGRVVSSAVPPSITLSVTSTSPYLPRLVPN